MSDYKYINGFYFYIFKHTYILLILIYMYEVLNNFKLLNIIFCRNDFYDENFKFNKKLLNRVKIYITYNSVS